MGVFCRQNAFTCLADKWSANSHGATLCSDFGHFISNTPQLLVCVSKSKPSGDAPIPGYLPFTHIPVSTHDMPLLMKLVAKVSLATGSFSTPYFIASVDTVSPHNCPRTRLPSPFIRFSNTNCFRVRRCYPHTPLVLPPGTTLLTGEEYRC